MAATLGMHHNHNRPSRNIKVPGNEGSRRSTTPQGKVQNQERIQVMDQAGAQVRTLCKEGDSGHQNPSRTSSSLQLWSH